MTYVIVNDCDCESLSDSVQSFYNVANLMLAPKKNVQTILHAFCVLETLCIKIP